MIINLIYILFFAASNFAIYSILNKTIKINNQILIVFIGVFTLFILFHVMNLAILMPTKNFFLLTFLLVAPIVIYFWFNYFALKRLNRLKEKGVNEKFVNFGIKVFSFFFLKFTFIMLFIFQVLFICIPIGPVR
jgi:hypothetical protein